MPRQPPPLDAFSKLARLSEDFPTATIYHSAADTLASANTYNSEAASLAVSVDSVLKTRWDSSKTGEVHLSADFTKALADQEASLPTIPNMTAGSIEFLPASPYVKVPFEGEWELPILVGGTTHTVSILVFLEIQMLFDAVTKSTVASLQVAYVEMNVDPPFDDPSEFPPSDSTAYAKKYVELEAYKELMGHVRTWDPSIEDWTLGKEVWRLEIPSDIEGPDGIELPKPFAIALWEGVSVFLKDSGGTVLGRNARSNNHHYSMLIAVEPFKAFMREEIAYSDGTVGHDESNWSDVACREVVVSSSSIIRAIAHFRHHHFIGGKKYCIKYVGCWDTRMWVGVRDDVEVDLRFVSVLQGRDVLVRVTPQSDYTGPEDDDVYYKNLRLLDQWFPVAKDGFRALIRIIVRDQLGQIEEEEITVPIPALSSAPDVTFHAVRLRGGAEETLQVDVDFDL